MARYAGVHRMKRVIAQENKDGLTFEELHWFVVQVAAQLRSETAKNNGGDDVEKGYDGRLDVRAVVKFGGKIKRITVEIGE